jgi:aryl-alcohol dehydrogenase-like predicted oxidoreductase
MIETRRFGRTGHLSTVTIFGAAALKNVTQARADRALELLLEYGVNHIDTAPRYGDAELRIGPWMREHRDRFFLATKTGQRTYVAARDEIRRSLERLQVDSVDLLQLHSLGHPDEWETAMGPQGALQAVVEAREEGLTRFIGVTGHGWTIPSMHHKSLQRFDFDSVLLPWNFVMHENARYREDFEALCKLCNERDVAVQTIKSIARGPWAATDPNRNTWYQPFEDPRDIEQAVQWVLGRPRIFLNTVGDLDLLPFVLDAANRPAAGPDTDSIRSLLATRRATSLFGIAN